MTLNARPAPVHGRAQVQPALSSGDPLIGLPTTPLVRGVTFDDDELYVIGLYSLVLRRMPDRAGFSSHVSALRHGADRSSLFADVQASAEALSVESGATEDYPAQHSLDELVIRGLQSVVLGAPLDDEVTRVQHERWLRGIPLEVIAHELDPIGRPVPWQLGVARAALRSVGIEGDATARDSMVAQLVRNVPLESVLATYLPGRSLSARLRRHRRASRAFAIAQLEALERAQLIAAGDTGGAVTQQVALAQISAELDAIRDHMESLRREVIASTGAGGPIKTIELDGMLLGIPAAEWRLAAYLERRGHPERGFADLLFEHLKAGSRFIDVGANLGIYTISAAMVVGLEGRVTAIEPTPTTAAVLRENIQLNGLKETGIVTLVEAAVGARSGRATLAVYPANSGHNSLYAKGGEDLTVEVAVTSLDDLVPSGERVDVVKIDVEGAELDVIRGMQRIAAENPDIAVFAELAEEHLGRAGVSIEEFLAETAQLGWLYDVFETSSGERPKAGSRVPLSVFLYRDAPTR